MGGANNYGTVYELSPGKKGEMDGEDSLFL